MLTHQLAINDQGNFKLLIDLRVRATHLWDYINNLKKSYSEVSSNAFYDDLIKIFYMTFAKCPLHF